MVEFADDLPHVLDHLGIDKPIARVTRLGAR
jgi:hypothetical protein